MNSTRRIRVAIAAKQLFNRQFDGCLSLANMHLFVEIKLFFSSEKSIHKVKNVPERRTKKKCRTKKKERTDPMNEKWKCMNKGLLQLHTHYQKRTSTQMEMKKTNPFFLNDIIWFVEIISISYLVMCHEQTYSAYSLPLPLIGQCIPKQTIFFSFFTTTFFSFLFFYFNEIGVHWRVRGWGR